MTRIHTFLSFLLVTALLAGCSGGGDSSDTAAQPDTQNRGQDATTAPDLADPADTIQTPDTPTVPELPEFDLPEPTHDKELGEACLQDGDCVSGYCFANQKGSGCTLECTTQADCQQYGLVCIPQRIGLALCAPPPPVQLPCADDDACLYPTVCIEQYGWCDMPECTVDGDCPDGQVCHQGARACQPVTCQSSYECASPAEFCLDGTCGPPDCRERADCSEGQICSYAQGICDDALPCNEEGACNWYNQACVDGLCEPNLCATPCANEAQACYPKTGKCGNPCNAPGSCPQGWTCDVDAGVCYENLPPVAAATVALQGATASFDGSDSVDPEGLPLTYRWMFVSLPPSSDSEEGTVFCQQPFCEITLDAPGLFVIGLAVQDAAGAWSPQLPLFGFVD